MQLSNPKPQRTRRCRRYCTDQSLARTVLYSATFYPRAAISSASSVMKIISIQLQRLNGEGSEPTVLCTSFDVNSFGFFRRFGVRDTINAVAKTLIKRIPAGQRQSVQHNEYNYHILVRLDGLACILVTDDEYPPRVAFALITKLMNEFEKYTQGMWKAATTTTYQDWPPLAIAIQEHQDPNRVAVLADILKELDETKAALLKNIERVIERGEKIDDLVSKSSDPSIQSKVFYKKDDTDKKRQAASSPSKPPADGFLASRDTYGSSSVWTDAAWLALIAAGKTLTVQIGSLLTQHEHSEVWRSACGKYALKGLRGNPAMTDVAAFVTRVSMLSCLTSDRVVKPLAALGSSALTLRVVTSLAEHGDLRSLLRQAAADTEESDVSWEDGKSVIALDVAEALEHLHSATSQDTVTKAAVVVGDLHTGRVLVDSDGHARVNLVSFGTASSANIKSGGFPYWSAPEVLQGGVATTASDVYAFGVLLCELDTGVAPYSDASCGLLELQTGVVSGELRPSVSDACPPRIRQLAVECMVGDPTLRPSAAQIVYRLRDIIKNDL